MRDETWSIQAAARRLYSHEVANDDNGRSHEGRIWDNSWNPVYLKVENRLITYIKSADVPHPTKRSKWFRDQIDILQTFLGAFGKLSPVTGKRSGAIEIPAGILNYGASDGVV